mgnify:CR=1
MKSTGILLSFIGLISILVVACSLAGCSADMSVKGDLFYWKALEPRTEMDWYSSAGGDSNVNSGFGKLGGGK